MPRLTVPLACRKDRTFSSSSRVPYWPYRSASVVPGMMARNTEKSRSVPGVARQGSGSPNSTTIGSLSVPDVAIRCSRVRSQTS